MSRRRARELAMQLLFQQDITQGSAEEIREIFWQLNQANPQTQEFADFLFRTALQGQTLIDDLIRRYAEHWRLERMAAVDRNILRMAVSEFLHGETPPVVVIDEAVEIARKYGTEKSPEFINGILDAIRAALDEEAARKPT